ncbi:hypothetical protein L596_019965 [Steinernema carpocapsae]|uniref:Uncharacterized protein n=1 Tax=Steinernema carpocapsae TaxID=34508 RepID=A0A4U5MSQ4_STECR|nr:hypothetical protein L596_019965 [Steinernema carpocapsae]
MSHFQRSLVGFAYDQKQKIRPPDTHAGAGLKPDPLSLKPVIWDDPVANDRSVSSYLVSETDRSFATSEVEVTPICSPSEQRLGMSGERIFWATL